jgi:hypothetical protein
MVQKGAKEITSKIKNGRYEPTKYQPDQIAEEQLCEMT